MFALAGFRPFWFHAVCFILLLTNVFLLYRFTRVLTGSREIALFAGLIGCFHSRLDSLYTSSGTVYELLCYGFFLSALLFYAAFRTRPSLSGPVLLLTQWCALDSKEMAATLPVLILAYELLFAGPVRPFQLRRWINLAMVTLLTAAFILPKLMFTSPLTQSYRPRYTVAQLVSNWEYYAAQLFYSQHSLAGWELGMILAALCLTAVLLRSRPLIFCCIWILVTPLPVSFIDQRAFYVWYIPLAGWTIYAAILLGRVASTGLRRGALAYASIAIILCLAHSRDRKYVFPHDSGKSELIRDTLAQFTAIVPTVKPDTHILFLNDPFDGNEWTLSSLLQLYYGDPDLDVQRVRLPQQLPGIPGITFDYVFEYRNRQLALTGLHRYDPKPSSQR